MLGQRNLHSEIPSHDSRQCQKAIGNNSKYSETWIGGPSEIAKPLHIPGNLFTVTWF
jgi:hypothetical protein